MTKKTIIEPFKIKVVEPLPMCSREQRIEHLKKAGNNLFLIRMIMARQELDR